MSSLLSQNNFKSIKAIIFDCDGTLVDSEPFHYSAWEAAFLKRGRQFDKSYYMSNFLGLGEHEISRIVETLGFSCSKELINDKIKFFQEYQEKGISPIASTVELARSLFQNKEKYGIKLAVASGATKSDILRHLKGIGIENYFEVIISGQEDLSEYQDPEGTNKPKPYPYLKTAKMLGVKPHECIAIEDSRTGVSSAVSAGCFTIAIPNHYTRLHDLSHAHMTIESLTGLSVEDFFHMVTNIASKI